jgi:hypothetical protein
MCVCVCVWTRAPASTVTFSVIVLVSHTQKISLTSEWLTVTVSNHKCWKELLCDKLFYRVFFFNCLLNTPNTPPPTPLHTPYRVCLLWFTEPFQLACTSLKPGRQYIIKLVCCCLLLPPLMGECNRKCYLFLALLQVTIVRNPLRA